MSEPLPAPIHWRRVGVFYTAFGLALIFGVTSPGGEVFVFGICATRFFAPGMISQLAKNIVDLSRTRE